MPSDKFLARSFGVLLGLGIAGIFIVRRALSLAVKKDSGAFICYFELLPPPQPAPPSAPHPLSGLTFAVKDIFNVEGYVTGFGNPDWANTHEPALSTAPAVKVLVDAGAKCIGKTHMDELAYSINGENKHYGTPVNPAAPSRIPGGSSSGSAVAVAADLVDFSLGTDTGGSVRIPAAYCGILGFRPSHGVIPVVGVIPMAQSFDTVGIYMSSTQSLLGWFAKDPAVLREVGHILLQLPFMDVRQPRRFLIADDCFDLSLVPNEHSLGAVIRSVQRLLGRQVLHHVNLGEFVATNLPSLKEFGKELSGGTHLGSLDLLRTAMQLLQRWEFKTNHEEWLVAVKPELGSNTSVRVQAALDTSLHLVPLVQKVRDEAQFAINELLKNDTLLVLPTAPSIPPKLNTYGSTLEDFRNRAFSLLSVAGMSGCCQVSLPVGKYENAPLAVSLLARQGSDRFLLDTVVALYSTIQEEAKVAVPNQASLASRSGSVNAAEIAKEKGNAAFKEKDFRKAVGHYTDAIRIDSQSATYYNNRAMAYLQLCSFPDAEADCTKAIGLDKKSVKAYLRRGTAREFLGYYKDANEDFRQALVLEPTNKTAIEAVSRLKKLLYN